MDGCDRDTHRHTNLDTRIGSKLFEEIECDDNENPNAKFKALQLKITARASLSSPQRLNTVESQLDRVYRQTAVLLKSELPILAVNHLNVPKDIRNFSIYPKRGNKS